MHVLLVGGAGFIGAHCAYRMANLGHEVTIVDDFSFPPFGIQQGLEGEELRFRSGSLTSKATIRRLPIRKLCPAIFSGSGRPPDAILHLASLSVVSHAERNPALAREVIVNDTRRVVECALAMPSIGRVVFVSSSMVYGEFSHDPMPECGGTRPLGLYGKLKLKAEGVVRSALQGTDRQFVIVRPSAVYGPGEVNHRVAHTFCSRAMAGQPLQINRSAELGIDFSYVTDVAAGLCLAVTHPAAAGETFNITYGEDRTLDELAALVAENFGPVRIRQSVQDGDRPRRGALDISKARSLLGYEPSINLERGIDLYSRHLARQRKKALERQAS